MFLLNSTSDYRQPLDPRDAEILGLDAANAVERHLTFRENHAETPLVALPAPRLGLLSLDQGPLGHDHPEGVQRRIETLDALQVRLDELARRDLPAADELGLTGDRGERKILCLHGRRSLSAPGLG